MVDSIWIYASKPGVDAHTAVKIGVGVIIIGYRVGAAWVSIGAVSRPLGVRIAVVVAGRWRGASIDNRRCASGGVVHVGTRDVVKISWLGAAVDGVRARIVGVGARSTVVVDRALVPTPGRGECAPPGCGGRARPVVKNGLRVVIGRARVQAAAKAAAAIITVEERSEVGGACGRAARNDRGTIPAIRCGVHVKVEGQRISAPYERAVRWCVGILIKVVRTRLHATCDGSNAAAASCREAHEA